MNRLLMTTLVAGSTALLCAGGCGDDEDENGTGGAAGVSGVAGTYGAAGVSGSAGRGGAGGTAGSAGSAGRGGAGGTMGSAGAAGTAGTGGAGTGGTGGSAGTAGTAGADAGPSAEVVTCPASGTTDITAGGPPFAFAPVTANVAVGGVVKFSNTSASPIEHTATSGAGGVTPVPDGMWDTGDIEAGEAVCVRFMVAGSYPYYCKYHAVMMTGTITVP